MELELELEDTPAIEFAGTGAQWRRWWALATIDKDVDKRGGIGEILVEITNDTVFTSATNAEKLSNCWAMVIHRGFDITGNEGVFVISADEMHRVVKLLDSQTIYTGFVADNEFVIKSDKKDESGITLQATYDYMSEGSTSWVPERDQDKGNRWMCTIIETADGAIPRAPPILGKDPDNIPYEQVIRVPMDQMGTILKKMQAIGTNEVTLTTRRTDSTLAVGMRSGRLRHTDVVNLPESTLLNWSYTFEDPVRSIFALAQEDILLAMTARKKLEADPMTGELITTNQPPALWFAIHDEDVFAYYWLEAQQVDDE